MFKIISDTGQIIGFTDELKYIKYDTVNKTILPTFVESTAIGILVDGYPYNLNVETIPNHTVVHVENVESGDYIFSTYNQIVKNVADIENIQQIVLDQDNSVNMMEEALMELDNSQAENEEGGE